LALLDVRRLDPLARAIVHPTPRELRACGIDPDRLSATGATCATAARKPLATEPRDLVPQLWKYLGWLARNTLLGRNEHEVAKQLLTTKLTKMRREEYRDPEKT
jgi:hypothetical protein